MNKMKYTVNLDVLNVKDDCLPFLIMSIHSIILFKAMKKFYSCGSVTWPMNGSEAVGNVLARRASRRPVDAHFWGKYIQNSPNLLTNLQGTCSLDAQLLISG